MKKYTKQLISKVFVIFSIVMLFICDSSILKAQGNEYIEINLDVFTITTDYPVTEFYSVYNHTSSDYVAEIYDKETKNKVDEFIISNDLQTKASGTSIKTLTRNKTEVTDGSKKLTWSTELKVIAYTSGSMFGQIDAVQSTAIYIKTYASQTKHEDDNIAVYPVGGSYPTTELEVSSSTSLYHETETSSGGSIGGSINIGKLFEAGFTVDTTTATTTIYR